MNEFTLTIRDILSRNSFRDAKVVAGKNGLDRQVKWSHILEVEEFGSLINGGEMILTTGIGIKSDLPSQLKFVEKLILKDVACLCIEVGPYFKEFQHQIIQLADQYDFPIITFEKTVKFVDITQDLHTFIINQHHEMLSQLDAMSRKLIGLSLMPNGILKILQELHHFFKQNVVFISDDSKTYYYPSDMKELETLLRMHIDSVEDKLEQKHFTFAEKTFALIPINGLGQVLGYLCLQADEKPLNEFTFLVLDRAALAIAQISLRNRTIEERKQNNEDLFIRNLLNGREVNHDDIQMYFPTTSRNMHYRVFVIQVETPGNLMDEDEWEEIKLQRAMMVRTLFKRNGFFPAVSSNKNGVAIIACFIADDRLKHKQDRFLQMIQHISNFRENNYLDGHNCLFGISRVYTEISNVTNGYDEATKVIQMKENSIANTYFYEDLGVFRLLSLLNDTAYLESYVQDYLSELLDHNKKTESDLFETLCVYLECGGSKKDTADRLFIVRQTLYHQLEKLESILGSDFMEPAKRLTLEVAIMAHRLIQSAKSN